MNRRKIDIGLSAFLILVSIIILTNDNLVEGGMETDLGSMFLPRIVAVFILMFSANIGIKSLIKLQKDTPLDELEFINTKGFLGIGIYIAIFIAYWFFTPILGFILTSSLAMIAIAILLGGRNWPVMLAVSVITPLFVFYGCENYLRVLLPPGTLF